MSLSPRGAILGIAVVFLTGTPAPAAAADPLPFRLAVEVEYGRPRGPEAFRDELSREIRLELARAGCFREVGAPSSPPAEDELFLLITLDDFTDEARHETSLAQRATSADPAISRFVVAYARATIGIELRTAADRAVLRAQRFAQEGSMRPLLGEDPRPAAREELLKQVVRRSRKFACKGSSKQLEKELAKARPAR